MKRKGNLYNQVIDINNLKLADKIARKDKSKQKDIKRHDRNRLTNIENLHKILKEKRYTTSEYYIFTIQDPKEREIFKLPYYPDRIVHHAIMNIIEPIFVSTFTADTYSCIKKRGIHKAFYNVKKALTDIENTQYCLQLDIKKFYPSVDHEILKILLRKKFKDQDLINLLDEIIDSTGNGIGIPIGNYLSQYFANFYLSYFDHWLKENRRVRYYFRYCDDLVIFSNNKEELHKLRVEIVNYLITNLKLKIKPNYKIFPIAKQGLDFVGYKFYHTHILVRDSIKENYINMIKFNYNEKSIASYNGWLSHCNSVNLRNKYERQSKFNNRIPTC